MPVTVTEADVLLKKAKSQGAFNILLGYKMHCINLVIKKIDIRLYGLVNKYT